MNEKTNQCAEFGQTELDGIQQKENYENKHGVLTDNQFDVIWVRAPKGTKTKWVRRAIQSGGSLSDYVLKAVNAHDALLSVLKELEGWGEYDVAFVIQERIKEALKIGEGA